MTSPLPFRDRSEAGRLLGAELASRNLPKDAIVLALPRGGVPVGFEVAQTLALPLDVVVVRKLGVPWQPELAMGAIASGGIRILDDSLIQQAGISQEEIALHLLFVEKELGEDAIWNRAESKLGPA